MAMKLTQYLRPECFIPDLAVKSRETALRQIIHSAAEKGLIKDENDVLEKLMERENVQSTAVGNGIAIPHCFADEIPDLIIVVALSLEGIEFDSLDGKPTQILFLIIGNHQEYGLHLKAVARIARLIKSAAFIEKIVSTVSARDLIRVFEEEEAKIR